MIEQEGVCKHIMFVCTTLRQHGKTEFMHEKIRELCCYTICLTSDFLFAQFRIVWWPSAGKELSSWISNYAVSYLMSVFFFVLFFCSFPSPFGVLGRMLEFDCIGSLSLPFFMYIYFSCVWSCLVHWVRSRYNWFLALFSSLSFCFYASSISFCFQFNRKKWFSKFHHDIGQLWGTCRRVVFFLWERQSAHRPSVLNYSTRSRASPESAL